jgi:phage tail-like protein
VASPRNLSLRAPLRRALPPVYRDRRPGEEPPLIERWVGAMERPLDPIAALLDNLPAHLDPALTPVDMLATVAAWLGLPPGGDLSESARRSLLARAIELSRTRGTRIGLQAVLDLALPELKLEVRHSGRVTWSRNPASTANAAPPEVEVRYAVAPDDAQRATIDRLVRDQLPVNVAYRLRAADAAES